MKYLFSILIALAVGVGIFITFIALVGSMWNITFTQSLSVLPFKVMGGVVALACTIKVYIEALDLHRTDDHIELEYVDNDHIFLN